MNESLDNSERALTQLWIAPINNNRMKCNTAKCKKLVIRKKCNNSIYPEMFTIKQYDCATLLDVTFLYVEDFEEQALSSAQTAPKIWKSYVDDTSTILKMNDVEDFLQHLNTQQPTIRFTMGLRMTTHIPFLTHWS